MARIPLYTSETSPQGRIVVQENAQNNPLTALGNMAEQTSKILYAKAENDALFNVEKDMAQARADWTQRFEDAKKNARSGGEGFVDDIMQQYREYADKMKGDRVLPQKAQQQLDLSLSQFGNQILSSAVQFQAGAAAAKKKDDIEIARSDFSRAAFNDPQNFSTSLTGFFKMVDTLSLNVDDAERYKRHGAEQIALDTVRGYIDRGNLAMASAALKGGPMAQYISGDQAAVLKNQIDAESRRMASEARITAMVGLQTNLSDAAASALASGSTGNIDMKQLQRDLEIAYPKRPDIVKAQLATITTNIAIHDTRLALAAVPADEGDKQVADLVSKISGTGAAEDLRKAGVISEAWKQMKLEREKDGATYVAQNIPAVKAAFVQAEGNPNDPTLYAAAIRKSVEAQRALGITNVSPLPDKQIADLRAKLASAPQGEYLNMLIALPEQMGGDDIYKLAVPQLLKNNVVTPAAMATAARVRAGSLDPLVAERIVGAERQDIKLPIDKKEQINKDLFTKMTGGIWGVFANASVVTGNAAYTKQLEAEFSGASHYVQSLAAGGASDPITKAVTELAGSRAAINQPGFAHVIFDRRGVNPDDVQLGLEGVRNRLALPAPDGSNKLQKLGNAQLYEDYRTRGVWVNDLSTGSRGDFVLILPGTTTAPVAPIRLTVQQAAEAGVAERKLRDQEGRKGAGFGLPPNPGSVPYGINVR